MLCLAGATPTRSNNFFKILKKTAVNLVSLSSYITVQKLVKKDVFRHTKLEITPHRLEITSMKELLKVVLWKANKTQEEREGIRSNDNVENGTQITKL